MTLSDLVADNYHVCGMENLYNSVTFHKRACNHKRKLKVHGVTRKGMRGKFQGVLFRRSKDHERNSWR